MEDELNGRVCLMFILLTLTPAHIPACTGFTAIVDKELTKKYDRLVADASQLVKTLPWGPSFEVDVRLSVGPCVADLTKRLSQTFRKPDFTGITVEL